MAAGVEAVMQIHVSVPRPAPAQEPDPWPQQPPGSGECPLPQAGDPPPREGEVPGQLS